MRLGERGVIVGFAAGTPSSCLSLSARHSGGAENHTVSQGVRHMSVVTTTLIVALGLKTNSIAALISRSTTIASAIEANKATFTSPTPPLATVNAAIATLTSAESTFKAHTGTRSDRDAARVALVALMQQLHTYVQGVVNANPSEAAVIAEEAAMALKKPTTHSKPPLAVKQTVSSAVKVVAKAIAGAKANDWQYSTDGGKTWLDAPTTTKASTTITGLVPGATVMYRHRPITKDGPGDWSQPITAVVT
jgi:hypothetical protein